MNWSQNETQSIDFSAKNASNPISSSNSKGTNVAGGNHFNKIVCWNCGATGHPYTKCPQLHDQTWIANAQAQFQAKKQ